MDDMISRQALMKEFSDFVRASNNSDFARTPTWNDAVSLVESMPSAQPERKTGRWLYDEERCATGIYAICSACDESIYQTGNFRYCPNCGARMMEGEG